jgi:hypothetical protein
MHIHSVTHTHVLISHKISYFSAHKCIQTTQIYGHTAKTQGKSYMDMRRVLGYIYKYTIYISIYIYIYMLSAIWIIRYFAKCLGII